MNQNQGSKLSEPFLGSSLAQCKEGRNEACRQGDYGCNTCYFTTEHQEENGLEPSGMKAATMRAQITSSAPNTNGGPGTRFGLLTTCGVDPLPTAEPFG
ncbi:hypothetical protein E2C01_003782 [Portunus trituberculatus]|uniref:Uncharacterized protein n=1 Tax=Portunus trituberculatus TaxID=210409 RepID=A0A5B7CPJ7_PORTR|nr:hypothetical protein [Portunus trituberculatus]